MISNFRNDDLVSNLVQTPPSHETYINFGRHRFPGVENLHAKENAKETFEKKL